VAPDFRAGGAPVKASSQRGSASLGGSSDNATASTNVASSPLAVPAVIAASPWSSPSDKEPFHRPSSGPGQGGAEGIRRQLDPFPQLAAEAEGSSGAEQRQRAGDRSCQQRGWRVIAILIIVSMAGSNTRRSALQSI
jgi:hypothetical protein